MFRRQIDADCMVALGEAATSFLVYQEEASVTGNSDSVRRACPNLGEISCFAADMPGSAFRSVLDVPKSKLVKLTILLGAVEPPPSDPGKLFEVLAEKVSTLEDFYFVGQASPTVSFTYLCCCKREFKEGETQNNFACRNSMPLSPSGKPRCHRSKCLEWKASVVGYHDGALGMRKS